MTDPTTPTDDDLSLALDGEADAELLARIEADPDARARLAALRAAADLVSAPVPPLDDDTVDEIIAAALDTPVAPARVARSQPRRATPWLVAAAVIVLMALGLSLVWAGRGTDDDQASASRTSAELKSAGDSERADEADSAFGSAEAGSVAADGTIPGGHGSQTTIAPSANAADLPLLYLGSFASADRLRSATATSFADALAASRSVPTYDTGSDPEAAPTSRPTNGKVPAAASVDRCAEQLQITLSLKAGPLQTGYATLDEQTVLVYEFPTTSARDGKETTLVAAVGTDACDEVVLFER